MQNHGYSFKNKREVKKLIPIIILLLFTGSAFCQEIKVRRVKKLPVEEKAYFPDFGKNHREILLSGQQHKGLVLYNRCKRKEREISKAKGAGSDYIVKQDGNIVFSETNIKNGRKLTEYKRYNPETGQVNTIDSPTIQGKRLKVEGKNLSIVQDQKEIKELSPIDNKFYIWASLSPAENKILFTAAGDGSYVSDLEGNILHDLGYLNAPQWLNENWVIGMDDRDDGEKVLSSDIIAVHLESGKRFNLTQESDIIAQYPKVSPEQNRIVYHSLDGDIYLMKIRIKE